MTSMSSIPSSPTTPTTDLTPITRTGVIGFFFERSNMTKLLDLAAIVFFGLLAWLIWDKTAGSPLSERVFFTATIGLVGIGATILFHEYIEDGL